MNWEILLAEPLSAAENMQLDSILLDELQARPKRMARFYRWKNPRAITHGYFLNPEQFFDLDQLHKQQIDLARRPTGGGVVFHEFDLSFALFVPATDPAFSEEPLKNYQFIHQIIWNALRSLLKENEMAFETHFPTDAGLKNFCMAAPTKYDLLMQGKKIAGAAQRKRKWGFLHQGTICLAQPSSEQLSSLFCMPDKERYISALQESSFSWLKQPFKQEELQEARLVLQQILEKELMRDE